MNSVAIPLLNTEQGDSYVGGHCTILSTLGYLKAFIM